MTDFLQSLTPINCILAGSIWAHELDDMNEVLFINQGSKIGMGYELNRQSRFPLEVSGCTIIGAFEVSFNRRSQFVYKANTNITGYFMRKSQWTDLGVKYHFFHQLL